jgi:hypothetical protein
VPVRVNVCVCVCVWVCVCVCMCTCMCVCVDVHGFFQAFIKNTWFLATFISSEALGAEVRWWIAEGRAHRLQQPS